MMRAICFLVMIFGAGIGVLAQGPVVNKKTRPNIVFILADDLGYFDLGCYGNPFNKTPVIDRLAKEGMKFTQAYSASPVCSPSRAAILTAQHPARLHLTNFLGGYKKDPASPVLPAITEQYLSPREITLAELLQANGYRTGIVGKWNLGAADSVQASAQGFEYDRLMDKGLDYYNYTITSHGKTVFVDDGTHYLADKLTDYGVEFIESSKDKPFFLYLAYTTPHLLIVPRADKLRNYFFSYKKFEGKYNPYYAAMIESMDDGVGRILQTLSALKLDENTIVIFSSDNGGVGFPEIGPTPTSMEPLRAWKGHVYEGGIRVPLVMKWPEKIQPDVVNENYLTNTDFLPTFMEIIGKKVDHAIDGKSFLKTLTNPKAELNRGPIFWHYPHFSNQGGRPAGAVRLGDFKLIEYYETNEIALYNLKDDISESIDLSQRLPQKAAEMHALFNKWKAEVKPNMPLPNPDYQGK